MEGEENKQLIPDIDNLREDILILAQSQKEEDNPWPMEKDEKAFEEYRKKTNLYYNNRKLLYQRDYAPRVTEIILRSEKILGDNNRSIKVTKETQRFADTNLLTMREMAESLSLIRAELRLNQKLKK